MHSLLGRHTATPSDTEFTSLDLSHGCAPAVCIVGSYPALAFHSQLTTVSMKKIRQTRAVGSQSTAKQRVKGQRHVRLSYDSLGRQLWAHVCDKTILFYNITTAPCCTSFYAHSHCRDRRRAPHDHRGVGASCGHVVHTAPARRRGR